MNRVKKCRHGDIVYLSTDMYIGRSFELYGEFSEGEVELFRKLVRPGDLVLDVGANIGAHTIALGQFVGPRGRVLAFEPQRIPYYTLCANVALNNLFHVQCYQTALGQAPGSIVVPDLDYGVVQNFGGVDLEHSPRGASGYSVPLLTIDGLRLSQCRLIKIDVEGMEKSVLQGAVDTAHRLRPILYVEDDRKEKSADLRAFLESLGYCMYLHTPPLYNPNNFLGNQENVFGKIVSLNLLCFPRESLPVVNLEDFRLRPVRSGGLGVTITSSL